MKVRIFPWGPFLEHRMLIDPESLEIIEVLSPFLHGTEHWESRYDIGYYIGLCRLKGFAKTSDEMILCAKRYIAGKRKVTPPGTKRHKTEHKKRLKLMANLPPELLAAVDAAVAEGAKAIAQYKAGNEKAINAVLGAVMKKYKGDPVIIKDLILKRI
jgi:hypothetical protein